MACFLLVKAPLTFPEQDDSSVIDALKSPGSYSQVQGWWWLNTQHWISESWPQTAQEGLVCHPPLPHPHTAKNKTKYISDQIKANSNIFLISPLTTQVTSTLHKKQKHKESKPSFWITSSHHQLPLTPHSDPQAHTQAQVIHSCSFTEPTLNSFFFNWSIMDLQYYISFRNTT